MEGDRLAGKHAYLSFLAAAILVAWFVRITWTIPLVGQVGSALVAILFLYAPMYVGWRRHESLDDYGFHADPMKDGIKLFAIAMAIIVPIFIVGYFGFYEIACAKTANFLTHLTPRGQCSKYVGFAHVHPPAHPESLIEFVLIQLCVVALPEELFFRGFLLGLLEKRYPPAKRWLGGGVGKALLISSAMFAVVHLPRDGDPSALATFFPGLMFGWMRSRTNSILASTLTHAGSNILIHVLELMSAR